jgi:glycerate 2-kinase
MQSASAVDVIAVGKAAGGMLHAFAVAAGVPLRTRMGIGPHRPADLPDGAEWHQAGHPIPDSGSVAAARRALDVAGAAGRGDLLVVLLSGGASALMALPVDTVTLADKQDTVRRLLLRGATIDELNTVRKHLSGVKGGRLAAASAGSVVTLAVSDVVGDDLSVIGSGPTVADPSTFSAALGVLDARGGRAAYPSAVMTWLERGASGEVLETPKPDDARLTRSEARIIGGRMTAVTGAADAARSRGYHVHVLDQPIVGEARDAARSFAEDVREALGTLSRPACVIGAGETTVHVKGDGLGGRNQEFALALLPFIADLTGSAPHEGEAGSAPREGGAGSAPHVAAASVGTDGIDGPTDAAGAIVDSTTLDRAAALRLDAAHFLDNNDSYHFFSALDDLVRPGPTGTNVGDLQVALIA